MAHINSFNNTETAPEAAPEATQTTEAPEAAVESSEPAVTDPTVAHAALTEIDTTGATAPFTNGHAEPASDSATPANADVGDSAANAAAETQWDANNELSPSQEDWVKVPRNPTETDTGLTATPAEAANVQSWADDQPEHPAQVSIFTTTHALRS